MIAHGLLGDAMADEPERTIAVGFDLNPQEDGTPEGPSDIVRRGGCLCGAVRYEARGAPKVVGLCHCGDCRKATGGFAMPWADWPDAQVRITGAIATFHGRSFCPNCGSRVVHLNPHHAEIMLGTLDEPPTDLVPEREIWVIRREPWMQPVPGAEQFDRDAD